MTSLFRDFVRKTRLIHKQWKDDPEGINYLEGMTPVREWHELEKPESMRKWVKEFMREKGLTRTSNRGAHSDSDFGLDVSPVPSWATENELALSGHAYRQTIDPSSSTRTKARLRSNSLSGQHDTVTSSEEDRQTVEADDNVIAERRTYQVDGKQMKLVRKIFSTAADDEGQGQVR
ncbi:hypothetical protein CI109_103832 [Kwoniella shandongensis]|uniref:Uncharacterized protein n=1 Tax=Kwoniella shandongensis TaxID=1734106 RepID=A0A5M6CAV9_9TREE|nr:uncharacterized protein CI109_000472 [Kwoniella shandongensis]KAA5530902.1 hypothetical protein CI109_000472 [Kwoniella shandongensis]